MEFLVKMPTKGQPMLASMALGQTRGPRVAGGGKASGGAPAF